MILIEELKKRDIKDGICIIGEPTNMKIIDAHKGCYEYTTYFKGLAGHSSAPHKGVSAVEYASRYVNKLIELREKLKERAPKDSIFDPPHSTLSIGGVFGGIAHNVIADKCHVNWETRPVVKEDGVEIARTRKRSSYEPNADISEAHEEVKKLADLYWTDEHKTNFQNKMDLI